MADSLVEYLNASVARRAQHVAVEEPPGYALTYEELDRLSDRVRDRLHALGVRKGDRVGIYLRKCIDAYAAMLGAMKVGAAYVPVDYAAPAWRAAYILHDCAVAAVFVEHGLVEAWRQETIALGSVPAAVELTTTGGGDGLAAALDALDGTLGPAPLTTDASLGPDDLAYILYTSGSTGKPKGVMLTHHCATAYVDWCTETFQPTDGDRFSSHAPFHFDLSILDLYVPLKHGATVLLINADLGKEPTGLAALIAERRLTVWYSTPTILTMLAQFGRLEQQDYSALRYVFFAGEVFPVKHLRAVKRLIPRPKYFNLYGPTETNVCTFHPIPDEIAEDREVPYPIGKTCSHFRSRVVDEDGVIVQRGTEGELIMAGPIMIGYWNLPERTASAYFVDADGTRWYRTGDVVVEDEDGVFTYRGRRDRMVKRRGYRIELGEIEAGLYKHAAVKEAAVVALPDQEGGTAIKAFVALNNGHGQSVIEMKRHCAKVLPTYMVPDQFGFVDVLPKTSTDKVDYQALVRG